MCVNAHTHTNTHRACEQSSDESDCEKVVIILSSNNKQKSAKIWASSCVFFLVHSEWQDLISRRNLHGHGV